MRSRGVPVIASCDNVQRGDERPDPHDRVVILDKGACVAKWIVELKHKVKDPHKVPAKRCSIEELQAYDDST